ncbi:2-keto-3-deoxy-phosphogluconate aldolase [Clostridium cavendishii DSM 21758]|uniref:2-keto-3-deoxy-phosphogluconate aldolase n=1 Tax=Clostridium cavendishii DSM 21758 TaxID=1121302 RepID=A0A1M6UIV2_9CLOT|nr:bifunctional 2-keto-4-hydroxyglutarate aldolase/2-keto-3-deoxy-6-phosphogluconate aldolase [Clostridium cavendishii]SHK69101.1 2-keto-3-deoxy-phosphogluconate aldolase [Clostridium cavendishii DSM 21758]
MLGKISTLRAVEKNRVVAVIRGKDYNEIFKIVKGVIEGGINIIEITFTIPNADMVIEKLCEAFKHETSVLIGAGTVLDSETARIAILRGAKFIVSPYFNEDSAKLCNRYGIPYMAGAMTIKEVVKAMEYGVDIVKLFPGSAYGPSIIKDIKGPLPQAQIMPTGGVSIENVDTWITNGAVAVGIGSVLNNAYNSGGQAEVTEVARRFIKKLNNIKS